jgi:K+ transporter
MGPDFILVNISVDFVDPILATEIEVTMCGLDRAITTAISVFSAVEGTEFILFFAGDF